MFLRVQDEANKKCRTLMKPLKHGHTKEDLNTEKNTTFLNGNMYVNSPPN
jgi:hypothetical protein